MTPRRSGLLSVLCSPEAFTGLTTRHRWTASQRETWTADGLRQLLLQQLLSAGAKPVGPSQHVTPAQQPATAAREAMRIVAEADGNGVSS
jgi:hypothetical protein